MKQTHNAGALGEVSTQTVEPLGVTTNKDGRVGRRDCTYSQHLFQYNYCSLKYPYNLQTTPHKADVR